MSEPYGYWVPDFFNPNRVSEDAEETEEEEKD